VTRPLFGVTAFLALLSSLVLLPMAALASNCFAYVEQRRDVVPVSFAQVQASGSVEATYVGHSTFRLTTPAGVVIATDYNGYAGRGPVPTVVTMNHAHDTHFTHSPDPAIEHVLRGWNPEGGPAVHDLTVADVYIRNVPTDIRSWGGTVERFGNSIFIFEVADLCIGHLGHLHHKPDAEQLARIGRLDVVFAPVDGSMTLDLPSMIEVLKDLRASLVIPMHYFGSGSLNVFLTGMAGDFDIKVSRSSTVDISLRTLPKQPTVLVLGGG
jgi:L-ascorbate metabolism protein UlaG (beta-lactamase superfamily)